MASSPGEAAWLSPESSSSVLAAWTAQTALVSLLGGFNSMAFYHPPKVHAFCFPCRFGLGPPLSHGLSHVTESGEGGPSSSTNPGGAEAGALAPLPSTVPWLELVVWDPSSTTTSPEGKLAQEDMYKTCTEHR